MVRAIPGSNSLIGYSHLNMAYHNDPSVRAYPIGNSIEIHDIHDDLMLF